MSAQIYELIPNVVKSDKPPSTTHAAAAAAAEPPTQAAQSGQPKKTPPPTRAEQQAVEFIRLNQVRAFGEAKTRTWRVGPPAEDVEVWKDEAGKRQCHCPELAQQRKRNPKAECQHILAVVLLLQAEAVKTAAVNGQAVVAAPQT